MRGLSEQLLIELDSGYLMQFTESVKSDTSLCMELRGNYVNIYYRGASLLKIQQQKDEKAFLALFDNNYFRTQGKEDIPETVKLLPEVIRNCEDVCQWLEAAPILKKAIDRKLSTTKKDEREFQQRILRDNNFGSIARSTDYYICDIEYQSTYGRFDMIAVHWPSDPTTRKLGQARNLAFIEVKHGDSALVGSAGLHKHIEDINKYSEDAQKLEFIKKEMAQVFNQKRKLGLLDCGKDLGSFNQKKPIFILAFVNHDPGKSKLRELLNTCPECPHVDLHVATASFLGYGLYDQGVHAIKEFMRRFDDYI